MSVRLTRRGEHVLAWLTVLGFIAILALGSALEAVLF